MQNFLSCSFSIVHAAGSVPSIHLWFELPCLRCSLLASPSRCVPPRSSDPLLHLSAFPPILATPTNKLLRAHTHSHHRPRPRRAPRRRPRRRPPRRARRRLPRRPPRPPHKQQARNPVPIYYFRALISCVVHCNSLYFSVDKSRTHIILRCHPRARCCVLCVRVE